MKSFFHIHFSSSTSYHISDRSITSYDTWATRPTTTLCVLLFFFSLSLTALHTHNCENDEGKNCCLLHDNIIFIYFCVSRGSWVEKRVSRSVGGEGKEPKSEAKLWFGELHACRVCVELWRYLFAHYSTSTSHIHSSYNEYVLWMGGKAPTSLSLCVCNSNYFLYICNCWRKCDS